MVLVLKTEVKACDVEVVVGVELVGVLEVWENVEVEVAEVVAAVLDDAGGGEEEEVKVEVEVEVELFASKARRWRGHGWKEVESTGLRRVRIVKMRTEYGRIVGARKQNQVAVYSLKEFIAELEIPGATAKRRCTACQLHRP